MRISLPPQAILLPCPVLIIGTYGAEGKPNIMNAAWGGIASSDPPCINVSLREATLTYHNIRQTQAFSVNFTSEKYIKEADYVGLVSGRDHDKFKETSLTPQKSRLVNAPIVAEFPFSLECTLVKRIDLGLHTMFIGKIVGIVSDSEVLNANQLPDIEKVRPMLFGSFGSMAYYGIGRRLGNVSVGKELRRS